MRPNTLAYVGLGVAAVVGVGLLFLSSPGGDTVEPPSSAGPSEESAEPGRTIRATLFYVSEDGLRLVGVEQEVPEADDVSEQARRIAQAQLAGAPEPLALPVPEGTKLRAIYLTDRGDAFVDLSREVSDGHSGGSLEELFTVYAIVNALTTNLPDVAAVQILVEGREVDTLAGHVDLRRPLGQNLRWVGAPGEETLSAGGVSQPAPG